MPLGAADDLRRIEETTDWAGLIEKALADPPQPDELATCFERWSAAFQVVYGRVPQRTDFPPGMDGFFRRLALADVPPDLFDWCERFEARHGRPPGTGDVPRKLRELIPSDSGTGGRPRCDTVRWRNAANAWTSAVLRQNYEMRRDGIAYFGLKGGAAECFGFDQTSMLGDRPSALALEKLNEETGWSVSKLQALLRKKTSDK